MTPIIKVENLNKTFNAKSGNVEAVKNVSFEVGKGDIFGIIGLSGAGKSTLVRCLNLLERPTSGRVLVDGKDLTKLPNKELRKARQNIGMIFQHFNLLMQRNVLDNVCFPMEIAGVKKSEARKRAYELLKTVGLEDKAKAYPAQLSGGQQQRVAIAGNTSLRRGNKCLRPSDYKIYFGFIKENQQGKKHYHSYNYSFHECGKGYLQQRCSNGKWRSSGN